MTTMTVHSADAGGLDIDRPAGALFAKVFQVYLKANSELKEVIESMATVLNDPAANEDERNAALDTLVEVLFAPKSPGEVGVDLEDSAGLGDEARRLHSAMASQEAAFADTVRELMKRRGLSQKSLARKIGVGQPAVSMILSRKCRPQRVTIHKIAKALGVDPKRLWRR